MLPLVQMVVANEMILEAPMAAVVLCGTVVVPRDVVLVMVPFVVVAELVV